jgi:hypothetical protein
MAKPKPAVAFAAKPATPAQAKPDPAAPQGPEATGAAPVPAAAAAAPVEPKPPARPSRGVAVVSVKGPAKGRWRAGRHFGPEPVEIPVDDLSDVDIARLKADPELTCVWPG